MRTGNDRLTRVVLGLVVGSLAWMIARAMGMPAIMPEAWEVGGATGLFALALGCVCEVAWRSTRR
jgi:hypothetical protein